MTDEIQPWKYRAHPGNRIRPRVRCLGCRKLGCTTAWGPWCFECNLERISRIDAAFENVRKVLGVSP